MLNGESHEAADGGDGDPGSDRNAKSPVPLTGPSAASTQEPSKDAQDALKMPPNGHGEPSSRPLSPVQEAIDGAKSDGGKHAARNRMHGWYNSAFHNKETGSMSLMTAPAVERANPFDMPHHSHTTARTGTVALPRPACDEPPLSRSLTDPGAKDPGRDTKTGSMMSGRRWKAAMRAGFRRGASSATGANGGGKKKGKREKQGSQSEQVVHTLMAGAPAAVLLGSYFLNHDHGHARIPVVLEQLQINVLDVSRGDSRRVTYRIRVSYGGGQHMASWTLDRDFRDLLNLHSRIRVSDIGKGGNNARVPKFPRDLIPYYRPGALPQSKQQEASKSAATMVAGGAGALAGAVGGAAPMLSARERLAESRRVSLERYLQELVFYFILRKESVYICRFLEISTLGLLLAAQGSHHGKEGWLHIKHVKGSTGMMMCSPVHFTRLRHAKWVLVRGSFLVFTSGPDSIEIEDIFLLDSEFQCTRKFFLDKLPGEGHTPEERPTHHPQHHTFKIMNSERTMKLLAVNERNMNQFYLALKSISDQSAWAKEKRFGSFAPVRTNVAAQWIVDARDYFWNFSRAIDHAKECIYIHDWWLSPELYLRRPAHRSERWRLDKLLQRKAEQGVKIYVVIYHNVGAAIPIDSLHTKHALLRLSPNVYVLRSPSHLRQSTFFWAHHEKICVIDNKSAFVGGIDLCFGRYDNPQHVLSDDANSYEDSGNIPGLDDVRFNQVWPGKDYSNARVGDFHTLNEPFADMYDRRAVPRMGWHDISMQVLGQAARDVGRHFVQRWNYILRHKTPSRPTPMLAPVDDLPIEQLEAEDLLGTCEVQVLRSSGYWSLGLVNSPSEKSILTAYIELIRASEHFVYIENQFFVTSCECDGTKIENGIGDALYARIVEAHEARQRWQCVAVIPLMPGFENPLDASDGSSVRLIMHAQYRSISRGPTSLFGRLRARGIDPGQYIQFFGLRGWAKIGHSSQLVTEMVYIHAKCMIVDDRFTIIGSANINERSMRGHRDSEVATIVRDTRMIDTTMNGVPYKVGHYNHTLRMRLMREHLGLDCDDIENDMAVMDGLYHPGTKWREEPIWQPCRRPEEPSSSGSRDSSLHHENGEEETKKPWRNHAWQRHDGTESSTSDEEKRDKHAERLRDGILRKSAETEKPETGKSEHNLYSGTRDGKAGAENAKADSETDASNEKGNLYSHSDTSATQSESSSQKKRLAAAIDRARVNTSANPLIGGVPRVLRNSLADTKHEFSRALYNPEDIEDEMRRTGKTAAEAVKSLKGERDPPPKYLPHCGDGKAPADVSELVWTNPVTGKQVPDIQPDSCKDPLSDAFFRDIWQNIAEGNTHIYREYFHCMPDDEVQTWRQFHHNTAFLEEFNQMQHLQSGLQRRPSKLSSGPPGAAETLRMPHIQEKVKNLGSDGLSRVLSAPGPGTAAEKEPSPSGKEAARVESDSATMAMKAETPDGTAALNEAEGANGTAATAANKAAPRRRGWTFGAAKDKSHALPDLNTVRSGLRALRGHLVHWPTDFLLEEDEKHNWLFGIDRLPPFEIYD